MKTIWVLGIFKEEIISSSLSHSLNAKWRLFMKIKLVFLHEWTDKWISDLIYGLYALRHGDMKSKYKSVKAILLVFLGFKSERWPKSAFQRRPADELQYEHRAHFQVMSLKRLELHKSTFWVGVRKSKPPQHTEKVSLRSSMLINKQINAGLKMYLFSQNLNGKVKSL